MNAIVPVPTTSDFEFEGKAFRTSTLDGAPIFRATDVALSLGYRDAGNMTRSLDDDETTTQIVSGGLGEEREVLYLSEPGLYRAIMLRRSVKKVSPETLAQIIRFQRWVTHDVLPSIRKTGSYSLVSALAPQAIAIETLFRDPGQLLALAAFHAQAAIAAEAKFSAEQVAHSETHQFLEDQVRLTEIESRRAETNGRALVVAARTIEEQQPIVERHRALVEADGAMAVTEAANVVGVSRADLFLFLRDREPREPWIYLRPGSDVERPFRGRCRRKELRVRLVKIQRSGGRIERIPQTLITPLGLDIILQEYLAWAAERARKAAQAAGKAPDLFDDEG